MTTLAGLIIKVGDDFSQTLTVTNSGAAVNLTGCTLALHLRAPGASTDAITPAPPLTLIDAENGVATLVLTDTQTGALTAGTTYRYEVEMIDGTGLVSTPVEGLALVEGDVG